MCTWSRNDGALLSDVLGMEFLVSRPSIKELVQASPVDRAVTVRERDPT